MCALDHLDGGEGVWTVDCGQARWVQIPAWLSAVRFCFLREGPRSY